MRTKTALTRRGAIAVAATISMAGALAACGSDKEAASSGSSAKSSGGAASKDAASKDAAADSGAGFEEYPVGSDKQIEEQANVAVVYFQPVDMKPAGMALEAAKANFHLEADISALESNTLGYGSGDFIPGLTVDYEITDKATGAVANNGQAKGTFMQMNASDGPHYGANIALPDAGQYVLKLTVHSPAENGWVLHSDPETGVKGDFWTVPAELSWDWDYTPMEW
ncbi:iron transporter [Actinomyces sp. zg296]|uniref:iron transporter n=1 Tax=Actinomyces sp. zg296 TaxID=2609289 RepID=UPI001356B765|nr:iron transporter [Actinomyces sp. zg296]